MSLSHDSVASGYDLVSRVLDYTDNDPSALIKLAGEGETEWLEFKAAMVGCAKDRKPNENDADGYWNVAEAAIAMANSKGGAILIGINDDGNAVGLASGDIRNVIQKRGLESFLREEIYNRLQSPNHGSVQWRTGRKGIWALEEGWHHETLNVRLASYQGKRVATVLVKPVTQGATCIVVKHDGEERMLKRSTGNVGQVESLRGRSAMGAWENERNPSDPIFKSYWERFVRSTESGSGEDEDLEAGIIGWHTFFIRQSADLEAFTALDATEFPNEGGKCDGIEQNKLSLFEPEGTEILPDFIREGFDDDFDTLAENLDTEVEDEGDWDEDDGQSHASLRQGGLFGLLDEEKQSILIGEPGSGKTTALRRLTLDAIHSYQPGGVVTIFLPLGQWQQTGGLWELLRRKTGLAPSKIEALLNQKRCRLLLDALNECPDALRPAAINAISELLSRFPGTPIVVSARTIEALGELNMPIFSVQPLSESKQKEFLVGYLQDADKASFLLGRLRSQPGGTLLSANPLLLRMIVDVADQQVELPQGRAGLYRRWIYLWYQREALKAAKANDPLPWEPEEALSGLAAVAFAARKRGMRIADDDMALESLANRIEQPALFLERMTQGPLVVREEGDLRFRHETFQEYLCAEALLKDPSALKEYGSNEKGTWAMPIAYAAELQNPMPEPLLESIWNIDPWLAAAIDPNGKAMPKLTEPLDKMVEWFRCGTIPSEIPRILINDNWYSSESALIYAIGLSLESTQKWESFELSQLSIVSDPLYACPIFRRVVALELPLAKDKLDHIGIPIEAWIEKSNLSVREELLKVCTFDEDYLEGLVREANFREAHSLIRSGVFSVQDFEHRFDDWAREATTHEALMLIKFGLMTEQSFKKGLKKWFSQASKRQARKLVKSGFMSAVELEQKLDEWSNESDHDIVFKMIRIGLKSASELKRVFDEEPVEATPEQAIRYLAGGLMKVQDFEHRFDDWIAEATPEQAIKMIKSGLISTQGFQQRFEGWSVEATPEQAIMLIRFGLMKAQDFERRFDEWAAEASHERAIALVKHGLINRDNWEFYYDRWLSDASPKQAKKLISAASKSNLDSINFNGSNYSKEDVLELMDREGIPKPEMVEMFLQKGFLSLEELIKYRDEWANNMSFQQAIEFVDFGFLDWNDFNSRAEEWLSLASPHSAALMLKLGLITTSDVTEQKRRWIAEANPSQLINLLDSGLFEPNEFNSRKKECIEKSNRRRLVQLCREGLFTQEDLKYNRMGLDKNALKKLRKALNKFKDS